MAKLKYKKKHSRSLKLSILSNSCNLLVLFLSKIKIIDYQQYIRFYQSRYAENQMTRILKDNNG